MFNLEDQYIGPAELPFSSLLRG